MTERRSRTGPIDAIILAAGASSRMGTPKQLLFWQGKSMINHVVEEASAVPGIRNLVLVLGNHSELILKQLPTVPGLIPCINPDPSQGLASSIRCGLGCASTQSCPAESVIVLLIDQLWVDRKWINGMLTLADRGPEDLVATTFPESEGSFGPPAIFGSTYWPHLLSLEGDRGAKSVLKRFQERLRLTPMRPSSLDDCDTPSDYRRWPEKTDHLQSTRSSSQSLE
jgi:molybdenum cofactor cytidylyltransferase